MKRCPTCQTDYPDDANWCRLDGGRLQPVQAAPAHPAPSGGRPPHQPGALTMGWDAQPDPSIATSSPTHPTPGARVPPQPGALTMGWDAQPDPSEPATPSTTPSPPTSGARVPPQPGALTMGWDAQPDPEAPPSTMSPAALAARSVATSHSTAMPAANKSPAATLLGMQAPWQQTPPAPVASAPVPVAAAEAPQIPSHDATAAYSAQPAPPAQTAPPSVIVQHAAVAPSPAASDPNQTQRTRSTIDDSLDRPPSNKLPIYALIAVVVIAAIAAVVLVMR